MDITDIIAKSLLGRASDEEMHELDAWLNSRMSRRRVYERLLEDTSLSKRINIMDTIDGNRRWRQLKNRIDKSSHENRSPVVVLSYIAKIAAVILIVVAIGWAVFPKDKRPIAPQVSAEVVDAIHRSGQAGKMEANITVKNKVAGGWTAPRTVKLSANAALASLLDNAMGSGAECELQTLQTSEYWFTLEDGTRVHLDYNSRIFFPVHFSSSKRQVYLDGTAYFFVAKDKKRPFYVNTRNGVVKEYGTEFVVNTRYVDETEGQPSLESTEVILVTGSISMITHEGSEHMMQPRDRMVVRGQRIQKEHNVDTTPYTAWNEGKFKFEDCQVDSLLSVISKWYGCNVVYSDKYSRKAKLTGTFDRYGQLTDILHSVSAVTGVDITQHNDTIIVGNKSQGN